ncbi:hypothetical protein B0H14DRAFT_3859475 [Mycena olivaceomarginata]|nr:hypothetical protein B0H14DRAFT_3859475 [Mycena olivaceomarginata]
MLSNTADFALFDAAADFTTGEVVEYRRFMFPLLLGDSTHVPFFSVEDAPRWMTARGYALYQELNLAECLDPLRDHRYALLRQLRAYREQVVGEAYVNHPFFQVDRAEDWVAPAPFNTWMRLMQELEAERGARSTAPRLAQSVVTPLVHPSLQALLALAPSRCIQTLAVATALVLVSHLALLPHLLCHAGPKGDVWVYAFSGERVRAQRAQLRCKGICVCEFVSEELFGDCERFEPDEQAMRDLWNHELDANEREAASPEAILSRFYTRVISSKCKTECDDAPIPASTDNSNDATISDVTGNSRSDEPTSNMTLYLTNTDTQMESHPGFELDPKLEPNHECKSTFIWSLSTLHSPVSLVFNDNTLQTDDTDSGFGFNIGLASTTPTHSDSPAVLALATTPAARRRRRQSVDENDIVEGSRQRTQSKQARGEA